MRTVAAYSLTKILTRLSLAACVLMVAVLPAGIHANAQTQTSPLRTVAEWEERFLGSWEDEHTEEYLELSTSGDSWHMYGLAYAVDANVAMFRATDNTQYLDRALLYTNNVIDTARVSSSIPTSQYQDGYLAWPSFSHPDGRSCRSR